MLSTSAKHEYVELDEAAIDLLLGDIQDQALRRELLRDMASNDLTRYSKDLVRRADAYFSASNAQLRKTIELIDANATASVQFIDSVRALTVHLSSCNSDINDAQALRKLLAYKLIYGRAAILASERVERAMIGGDTAEDALKSIKNRFLRPPN